MDEVRTRMKNFKILGIGNGTIVEDIGTIAVKLNGKFSVKILELFDGTITKDRQRKILEMQSKNVSKFSRISKCEINGKFSISAQFEGNGTFCKA